MFMFYQNFTHFTMPLYVILLKQCINRCKLHVCAKFMQVNFKRDSQLVGLFAFTIPLKFLIVFYAIYMNFEVFYCIH